MAGQGMAGLHHQVQGPHLDTAPARAGRREGGHCTSQGRQSHQAHHDRHVLGVILPHMTHGQGGGWTVVPHDSWPPSTLGGHAAGAALTACMQG